MVERKILRNVCPITRKHGVKTVSSVVFIQVYSAEKKLNASANFNIVASFLIRPAKLVTNLGLCQRLVLTFLYNWVDVCINVIVCGKNSVALVRERTVPTERSPPVGEVTANFLRIEGCHVVSATDPHGR